jgi:hypothetical protein
MKYLITKKGYGNQSYNSRPNNQNWQGNQKNSVLLE